MSKRLNECLSNNFNKEYILPFFWQHGEPWEDLEKEMDAMRACGITEMCVESRTHEQFGEDKWWDDFKFILDYAKKQVMALGGEKIKIGIIEESSVLKNWYNQNGFIHIGTKKFSHLPFTSGYLEWVND